MQENLHKSSEDSYNFRKFSLLDILISLIDLPSYVAALIYL